jgi:hypothetical protein
VTHGITGYCKNRCRCDICRRLWAAYQRRHYWLNREKRAAQRKRIYRQRRAA